MQPSNVLYLLCTVCMCMISSGRTRGAAAEADAVGEKQLKRTQSGCTSVCWPLVLARDTTTQGCWCVRVGGYARLTQTWWRRWDYRSITKRTVVRRAVLLKANSNENSSDFCVVKSCRCWTAHVSERRGVWNRWTGLLGWTTGLEFMISHFTNLLHALYRRPA